MSGSSTDEKDSALSKSYKADPSIENYVRLRRENPDAEIEVSVIGGFESMFYMRDELERYGIDPDLLGGVLDADLDAIGEISLRVMEKMIEARHQADAGETHLVRRGLSIPDRLVDWVICCSLDALSWNHELTVPRDLIVLARERLGGSNPQYEQEGEIREKKSHAEMIAGQLKARGTEPTLRVIGQALGVAPSTVKRWFEPGELDEASDRWSKFFDKDGKMLPLSEVSR